MEEERLANRWFWIILAGGTTRRLKNLFDLGYAQTQRGRVQY
jgi:hypothetical protein